MTDVQISSGTTYIGHSARKRSSGDKQTHLEGATNTFGDFPTITMNTAGLGMYATSYNAADILNQQ